MNAAVGRTKRVFPSIADVRRAFAARAGLRSAASLALCGVCAVAAAVGCAADARMNVQEFVEYQRLKEAEWQQAAAASQPAPAVAESARDRIFGPYRLGPGDVLLASFLGLNETADALGVRCRVSRNGELHLPLGQTVQVGGKTMEEAEDAVRRQYVPNVVKSLSVNLEITTYEVTQVVVRGAVSSPGFVQLRRNECDLFHAVAAAGGFSQQASGRVLIERAGSGGSPETFDLLEAADRESAISMAALGNGDVVSVDTEPPYTIFVGGLVNVPGPKNFPAGTEINLLQVLAASGGEVRDLFPDEATLIRRMPDGKDVQVRIDLEKLHAGLEPNLTLAAGDIVWVPPTAKTQVVDFINRNLFLRAGVSVTYDPIQVEQVRRAINQQEPQYRLQKRQALLNPFSGAVGTSASNALNLIPPVQAPESP